MRRSIFSTLTMRFAGLAALALGLTLAPSVFLNGGDVSEAKGQKQASCEDRLLACSQRCTNAAAKKYGTSATVEGAPATKAAQSCYRRTCEHQYRNCTASSKGTKSVKEAPPTKVQPKVKSGGVNTPKAAPKTQPKVQPTVGAGKSSGGGGPVLRRTK